MKIMIDIDQGIAEEIVLHGYIPKDYKNVVIDALKNGKPLPEHHGMLIDADELYGDFIDGTEGYDCNTWNRIEIGDIIDNAPTIIGGSERMKNEGDNIEALDKLESIIVEQLDKSTDQEESMTLRWVLDKMAEVEE